MKYGKEMKVFLYFVLMITIGVVRSASASEKPVLEQQVTIEHAEIILPVDESDVAQAYLVIWNGTGASVRVKSVSGESGLAKLVSQTKNSEGKIQTVTSSMPRFIPPKSELVMKRSGHYLMIPASEMLKKSSNFLIAVEFGDGRILIANAMVLPAGSLPTDHHHGSNDS